MPTTWVPASSARKALLDTTGDVPRAIKHTRKNTLDFLNRMGQPVIFKHKWTEDDVAKGLAQYCPYCRNVQYRQANSNDPNCFGTGYLGGFGDGVLLWMTFGDSSQDLFKLTREGALIKNNDPLCNAPWEPAFEDGDLLIQVTLAIDLWTITSLGDRYIVNEVTPVTPRGANNNITTQLFAVAQQFQADQIQPSHPFMTAPVIFDYSNLPAPPAVPPGGDPKDYGQGSSSSYEVPAYLPAPVKPGSVQIEFE